MTTVHVTLRLLLVHWFTFLDSLQWFFGSYTPMQPTLSPSVVWKFPSSIGIEEDSTASVSRVIGVDLHIPPIYDGYSYGGPADSLTTMQRICRVPIIFSAPLVMNLSCFIDPTDYDYDVHSHDVPAVALNPSQDIYPDTPGVWEHAAVPKEDDPPQGPASWSTPIGDDAPPSHMASYGTPGLSFCPVLVGITYVGSLVYLYMLLMIPSILYHWSEDLLAYDTLDPTKMLHASQWTTPWSLLRRCVRKAVPRIGRRRVRKPGDSNSDTFGRPSIPLIVVEGVDGKVIPVFTDDVDVSYDISVGAQASLEENPVSHGQDVSSSDAGPDVNEDDDLAGLVPLRSPISSHSERCVAIEIEAPVTWTDSHQGDERIGDVIRVDVGLGSLMSDQEFAEDDVRSSCVNDTPDARLEVPHVLVGGEDDPFRFVEKDGLGVLSLVPDALGLGAAFSDCNVDKRTEELEWMTFLGIMTGDVSEDGMDRADDGDVSSGDLAFSPWSLVSDRYGPDEPEMPSDTVSERSPSVGLQDTPILGEDVSFVMDDDASGADCYKVSLSGPRGNKRTCAWNLGSKLGDNGVTLEETPVQPPDSLVDKDATLSGQASSSMLFDAMLGEERFGENDIVLAEPVSPSFTAKPTVKLPLSLVTERDDVRDVEEGPADSELVTDQTVMEDVATQSPLQMLYPTSKPAVVIKTGCLVEAKGGQSLSSFQVLDHEQRVLDLTGTLDKAVVPSEAVDVTSPREAGSCLPSPPIEGSSSSSLCHPRVESDIETRCGDIRTPGVTLSTLPVSEINLQETNPTPIVADIIRNGAIEVHGAREVQEEVSYETRNYLDVPRDDPQGAEVGITDQVKTNTSEHSMVSAHKLIDELDHVKKRDAGAIPSRPSPKRTLSGSIHAPTEPRPMPQMGNYVDRTCVLYEMPHSVSMARFVEGKNSTGMTVTENAPGHGEDLSASIRVPQRASELDMQSTVSQSQDENDSHHRIARNLVSVSESKVEAKSCSPNWAAMPEVVDAFRMFKQTPKAKSIRSVSSVAEMNRGPTFGIVGQKGNATHSLNNASAVANMQSRWMHGSGLLLVREVVSADPSDFNLRSCTNPRKPKMDRTNAMPVHQVLYPGMHDIPRSMAGGSTITQRPKSLLVPRKEEIGSESMLGYQTWMPYRD